MRAKLILAAALLVVPLAIAGYAIADSGGRNDAAKAQSATARYHDLQNALKFFGTIAHAAPGRAHAKTGRAL